MDNQALSLQSNFLKQLCEAKETIAVYLANGVQLRGKLEGFDDTILLIVEDDRNPLLVYRRAISTVMAM